MFVPELLSERERRIVLRRMKRERKEQRRDFYKRILSTIGFIFSTSAMILGLAVISI